MFPILFHQSKYRRKTTFPCSFFHVAFSLPRKKLNPSPISYLMLSKSVNNLNIKTPRLEYYSWRQLTARLKTLLAIQSTFRFELLSIHFCCHKKWITKQYPDTKHALMEIIIEYKIKRKPHRKS